MFAFGISLFVLVCCYAGLLVYAAYFDCDPKLSGLIKVKLILLVLYEIEPQRFSSIIYRPMINCFQFM